MGTQSRRTFLKRLAAAGGAAVLGPTILPGAAHAQQQSSRVVTITDGRAWSGPGWTDEDLDPAILRGMLDRVLLELTGLSDTPDALAALFPGIANPDTHCGIKVNCVNADLPTHPKVALALADLLLEAGAPAENTIVFDRSDGELTRCGYEINTGSGCQVFGSDHPGMGYGEAMVIGGASVRLSRIITTRIEHLVSLAVLKNHTMAGITLTLKNHFGSIDQPMLLHGTARDGSPGIAELNAQPAIRDRARLALIDATFSTFISGLAGKPDFAPMTLIASTDPVAADAVGQDLINQRRAKDGLPPIDARHLHDAAALGLGIRDLASIDRRDVLLHPVTEKAKPWETRGLGCSTADPGRALALGAGLVWALSRDSAKR